MGTRLGWVVAVVLASSGVAHAGGKHQQWKAVKRLGVDIAVEVRSRGQAGIEECRVVHVDDKALTCEREKDPNADWGPSSGARLVFPRDAVEDVWVWQDVSDRRVLIAMGIGFGIGALLCSEGGPGPAFICAGIGALIGAAFASSGPPPRPWWYPGPPPPARPPEMVRQLVYQAPAGGVTAP
jgi:hypothetical protein